MDDANRRRLQHMYDNIDSNSAQNARILQEAAAAAAAASRTSSVIRDNSANISAATAAAVNQRLLQQNRLQHVDLLQSNMIDRQSREEQMRWLIRNDASSGHPILQMQQQILGLDNYPTNVNVNTASQMTGNTDIRQRMEQLISTDFPLHQDYANQNSRVSTEMLRNFHQQNKNDNRNTVSRNQHRELMLKAALNLQQQQNTNVDISSLLGEANIASAFPSTESNQYASTGRRQLLSPLLQGSDPSRFFSDSHVAQLPISSTDNRRNTALGNVDLDVGQQLLIDEYLRSQDQDLRILKEMDRTHQKQQYDELYGQSNRLAMLLQQRQQLEQQMKNEFASSSPSVRNISLKNDEADVVEQPIVKIRKIETYLEKPKRPLSAYNIFFREQRQLLLGENDGEDSTGKSGSTKEVDDKEDQKPAAAELDSGSRKRKRSKPHHKVTFEQMAKIIGQRWKELETDEKNKKVYQDMAQKEKKRYQLEMIAWRKQRNAMSSMKKKKGDDNSY